MTDILTTTAAAVAPTVDYFGNQLGEIVSDPLTAAATWINETFASFDHAILSFYHNIRSEPLDVFVQFFTKLGDGGIFLILLGLFLLLFKKSRKVGFGMILGIAIGALFTNILIKNQVARPRPYMISEEYRLWFSEVWHYKIESEFSFPSGHTTAAMATMTPVFLFLTYALLFQADTFLFTALVFLFLADTLLLPALAFLLLALTLDLPGIDGL